METSPNLRKILVPLDGTKHSESILPYLERLAQAHQAQLELLHVIDPLNFSKDTPSACSREQVDKAHKYLRQLKNDCPDVSVETVCGLGPVVQVIRERAASEHCDLIAFSPRGHGGLERWLYGSVAESVVRDAPCPVLLIRGERHVHFHHVLLPLVEDDDIERLLRYLGAWMRPDTRLTLLHCCGSHPVDGALRARISSLLEQRPNTHFLASQSKAPQGILDWAQDSDCDLIAMSTHGLGGFHHLFQGSVVEQVSRKAPCPVLVFPSEFKRPDGGDCK